MASQMAVVTVVRSVVMTAAQLVDLWVYQKVAVMVVTMVDNLASKTVANSVVATVVSTVGLLADQ